MTGKVFLDKSVVEIGRLLDKLVIVVSVVSDIELAVCQKSGK